MSNEKLNSFIKKNSNYIWIPALVLFVFFSFLTFDAKISVGGDDSWYIIAAKKFLDGVEFPQWHGAFYPILLSILIKLGGINVILFKIISIILVAVQIYIISKTFKDRLPYYIWAFVVLLISLNSQIIHYAGTTYSEALFLLLQSLVFYSFFSLNEKVNSGAKLKDTYKNYLLLGLLIFLLSLTRNVGFGALLAVIIFFIIRLKYKASFYSLISFLIFYLPYNLYKKIFWSIKETGFEGQLANIAYKNFYNRGAGKENFWGFIQRFWDNSELYFSKHLMKFYGLKNLDSIDTSFFVTIFIYALFIISTIYIFKKYKQHIFTGLYLAILIGGTFITQQKHWDQERLILVYLPFISAYLLIGVYEIFKIKIFRILNYFLILFLVIILFSNLNNTFKRIDIITLSKNLKGNKFAGYTPDWKNYLSLSEWAGKNIDKNDVILCRKPNMSKIYGNCNFLGLYRVPSNMADSIKIFFEKRNIKYILVGSLRRNEKKNTGYVITTVRNTLKPLLQKYPTALKLIKVEGKSEYACLFELTMEKKGALDEMKTNLESGLVIFPENINANYLLSKYYLQKKEFDKSLKYINIAIKYNKENANLYIIRGNIYFMMKNFKLALKDFNFVISKNPQNSFAWYNLAICHYNMKNFTKIKDALQKAKALGYKNIPASLNKYMK